MIRRGARPSVALGAALVLAAACGEGTGPAGSVAVTVSACVLPDSSGPKTCPAAVALPNQGIEITVRVVPPGTGVVQQVVLTVSGVLQGADTFVATSSTPGPAQAVDSFFLPPSVGFLTLTAAAKTSQGSAVSQPLTIAVSDTVPPVVTQIVLTPPDSLEPGDSLAVAVTATDAWISRPWARSRSCGSPMRRCWSGSSCLRGAAGCW